MNISDNKKYAPILNIIFGRKKMLLLNYLTKNMRVYSHVNTLSYFIMKKTSPGPISADIFTWTSEDLQDIGLNACEMTIKLYTST